MSVVSVVSVMGVVSVMSAVGVVSVCLRSRPARIVMSDGLLLVLWI